MKNHLLILLLFWGITSTSDAQYDSIFVDEVFRTYLTHLPDSYTGEEELPLVLALHGGTGNAFNLQNQSQLSVKSDEEGFIVVYPEGLRLGLLNIRTWNAGWCCGQSSFQDIDDVGFIDQLLDELIDQFSIDESRIFITGISNGGYMSYRLACELSDGIAAIAPVAASISINDCQMSEPIPAIHLHSYEDKNVRYQGGFGEGLADHYSPPLDSLFDIWSNQLNCQTVNDTLNHDDAFTHVVWKDCDCETEIQYYISTDGGHSWPGGNATPLGDPASAFINANDLMWSFFENNPKDCISNTSNLFEDELEVYPNPTNEKLFVNHPEVNMKFKLYDLKGTLMMNGTGLEINLGHLTSGIYLGLFETNSTVITKKIIIKQE